MPKSRLQITEARNRAIWRITRLCCLPVIVFNPLVLLSQEGATRSFDITRILRTQESATRVHHPDARLFQVFVSNFVPAPVSGNNEDVEVHGYYSLDSSPGFLEVTSRDSKQTTEGLKAFQGNDCFHGHPSSHSESCSPSTQVPTSDEYLSTDWTLDSTKLEAALRKNGIDPSRHFDITILNAQRVVDTWKGLNSDGASPFKERARGENSKEAVVSVTERYSGGRGDGTTWLFRAADYELLGTLAIAAPKRLPPARKNVQ